jgi:hypothetical protein
VEKLYDPDNGGSDDTEDCQTGETLRILDTDHRHETAPGDFRFNTVDDPHEDHDGGKNTDQSPGEFPGPAVSTPGYGIRSRDRVSIRHS